MNKFSRPLVRILITVLIIFPVSLLNAKAQALKSDSTTASDSVTIMGRSYAVPVPWQGHKIGVKSDAQPDDLVMLPLEYGYDSSRIYVTPDTKKAFMSMAKAAKKDSVFFEVKSGYRSYVYQAEIFARRMKESKNFDDIARVVAPPGYSEHILGTAVDLVTDTYPFAESKAYEWLRKNAGKFGFMESYPKDSKEGFSWEAWHWRFMDARDTIK